MPSTLYDALRAGVCDLRAVNQEAARKERTLTRSDILLKQ